MVSRAITLALAVICLYMIMGCTTQQGLLGSFYEDRNLVYVGYIIADKLLENTAHFLEGPDPLIVASFVNVNNLEESSSFGRIIAEQVVSRFVQRGHRVVDLKLRQDSIAISEGRGEFLLSRDAGNLNKTYNASAVVVGTYADGGDRLYVSARLVRATDHLILSAYDAGIPMDPMVMNMILLSP